MHSLDKKLITNVFTLFIFSTLFFQPQLTAQFTFIIDSTFDASDWGVEQNSVFGATIEVEQRQETEAAANSFRYIRHTLAAPPTVSDLALIEAAHIYEARSYSPSNSGPIESISFSFDSRLLNLTWDQAFFRTFCIIRQAGILYRGDTYHQVLNQTQWQSATLTYANATHFTRLDGMPGNPDFSENGSELYFGFWRGHSRFRDVPVPASDTLVVEHGIDNFVVSFERGKLNTPPSAHLDHYYLATLFGTITPYKLDVLENDSDFDNDTIWITKVTEPEHGTITRFTDRSIYYMLRDASDFVLDSFDYYITDGKDTTSSGVLIVPCNCVVDCLPFAATTNQADKMWQPNPVVAAQDDSFDVNLFRRFRDEVLATTEQGQQIIDAYYEHSFEILNAMIFGEESIKENAVAMAKMLQPTIRNVLESDGQMPVSQALVDTVKSFLNKLTTTGSDSLVADVNMQLTTLGSLDNFANIPIKTAAEMTIGDTLTTSVSERKEQTISDFSLSQNYPNPFNMSTRIHFQLPNQSHVKLQILNTRGQVVKTLLDENRAPGTHFAEWDGVTNHGLEAPSGLYFARFQAGIFRKTMKLMLMK